MEDSVEKYGLDLHCTMMLEEYRDSKPVFEKIKEIVCTELNRSIQAGGLYITALESRIKTEKSLAGKLELKGSKYTSLTDITTTDYQHVIRIENKTEGFQALNGIGIETLEKQLTDIAHSIQQTDSDIIVTNLRHVEALRQALQSIRKVENQLTDTYTTGDIIALDLHQCIDYLAEITGDVTSDDTLHSIFRNFCIGK